MGTTTTFFFWSQCKLTQQHFIYKMANARQHCLLRIANGQTQFSLHRETEWAHFTQILVPLTHTISKRLSVRFWGRYAHVYLRNYRTILRGGGNSQRPKKSIIIFYLHSLAHELCYFVISDFDLNSINICHWPTGCLS